MERGGKHLTGNTYLQSKTVALLYLLSTGWDLEEIPSFSVQLALWPLFMHAAIHVTSDFKKEGTMRGRQQENMGRLEGKQHEIVQISSIWANWKVITCDCIIMMQGCALILIQIHISLVFLLPALASHSFAYGPYSAVQMCLLCYHPSCWDPRRVHFACVSQGAWLKMARQLVCNEIQAIPRFFNTGFTCFIGSQGDLRNWGNILQSMYYSANISAFPICFFRDP